MGKRHGSYGFDAPWALAGLLLGAVTLAALTAVSFTFDVPEAGVAFLLGGTYTLASAGSHLYTTRRGKRAVWAAELDRLEGGERLLDLGCGRGAVLTLAAERLPEGHATGLDQHAREAPRASANAEREGVADRVSLVVGDLRDLPFENDAFDVVVSDQAIHAIARRQGREQAVREALRVLRPGGLILIADPHHTRAYEDTLRSLGVVDVRRRDAGWRFWYGGPWSRTEILEARSPVA
ncbi:class I SAM-dependent methyltransferase [Nonomuraea longispora]|uniref:Class I SAM-dependent methyltransferase n=1 Tax=Nonomuraea longispora TaxID=1848320 RepID=A0A4R4NF76_9ACTN|nr:class I SAM-dependent methyltransferase [Nonomuraea longispora]TDC05392.1 class I SAM-dependent methyltransferase [Nonomuraea longispora]